jgi:hypothetical protein
VLITRCAWHRGYHGHPALIGVTDWRGLRLGFSDGICSQCAAQLRADVPGSPLTDPRAATDVAGWMPGVGLVTIAVMAIVLFAAQPVHDPADVQQIAAAASPEPSRATDLPRSGGVVAPRAVDVRSGQTGTRRAHPRGAGPIRSRPGGQTAVGSRGPSQSP